MTKRIETTNRKAYIKELLKTNKDIYSDPIVKTWNISKRQIDRYIQDIKKPNYELNRLLAAKNDTAFNNRIPKELSILIDKYIKKHSKKDKDLTKNKILVKALYEYLDKYK